MLGQGTEASLLANIVFWVIAVSSIVAALAVVLLKDLFRAALFLIVSFLGVAGMFVLLRASSSPLCRYWSMSARFPC